MRLPILEQRAIIDANIYTRVKVVPTYTSVRTHTIQNHVRQAVAVLEILRNLICRCLSGVDWERDHWGSTMFSSDLINWTNFLENSRLIVFMGTRNCFQCIIRSCTLRSTVFRFKFSNIILWVGKNGVNRCRRWVSKQATIIEGLWTVRQWKLFGWIEILIGTIDFTHMTDTFGMLAVAHWHSTIDRDAVS